jgi:hypothetical protein
LLTLFIFSVIIVSRYFETLLSYLSSLVTLLLSCRFGFVTF